jgi:hypothetical protein
MDQTTADEIKAALEASEIVGLVNEVRMAADEAERLLQAIEDLRISVTLAKEALAHAESVKAVPDKR